MSTNTNTNTNNDIPAKIINVTSKIVPMHLQIKALKHLMKVKKEDHWSVPPSGELC